MRQKFEAEQPDEMDKNNQSMDRSQGAARAISVSLTRINTADEYTQGAGI